MSEVRPGQPLTDRERQFAAAVAEGLTNTQIAERLFISENTVKTSLRRIHTKLALGDETGQGGRVALIVWWNRRGVRAHDPLPGGLIAVPVGEYERLTALDPAPYKPLPGGLISVPADVHRQLWECAEATVRPQDAATRRRAVAAGRAALDARRGVPVLARVRDAA